MYETTDIALWVEPERRWLLSPQQRTALADIHWRVTRLLEFEEDEEHLRVVYAELWKFCEREGYADTGVVADFLNQKQRLTRNLLRAVLHQILCRMLRQASGMDLCQDICCCNCVAAPDDIACIKHVYDLMDD